MPDLPAEGAYGRTLGRLHRYAVRTDLALAKVLAHLGVAAATESEIDAAIGER